MKRKSIRCVSIFLSLFLLLSTFIFSNKVRAEENEGTDIVFVVDDSASMQENDPNKLAGEAVRRFVDLLPAEGDRAGIVTYSYDPLERQDLVTISGADSKQILKKFSIEKIRQDGRNTDTAAGLSAGGSILDTDTSSAKKAIILITDGENDLRNRERTIEQSNATLEEFLKKGYPVYTIGVNPQTDTFKEYLTTIAKRSNGKVWFPKSSEELNAIIKEVASELGNVALANSDIVTISNTDFTNIKQTVPKDVLEANIQIDHEEPIKLEVVDSNGKSLDLEDKSLVIYSENKYTNVKLLTPKEGDWTIRVKSTTKQIQVKVDWIFNYDVMVNLSVPKNVKVGETKTVEVTLLNKGKTFTADQYQNVSGSLAVTDSDSNKTTNYDLKIDGNRLVAEVAFKDNAKYTLVAHVTGDNLEKSSRDVTVNLSENVKESKSEKGLPFWVLILGAVGALGVLTLLILILMKRRRGRFVLQGSITIQYIDAAEIMSEVTVRLPQQTSVKLSDLVKNHASKKIADIDERLVTLTAVGSNQIKIELKKNAGFQALDLRQGVLSKGSTTTLTKNRAQRIVITY